MKNFPILFSQEEITKFIEPIKSIDGRIDFFNFLLKIYDEAFNHSSDEDIIKYITKYNITTNAAEEKDLSSPSLSVLLIEVENRYRDFKYKSSKFINLQISISQLRIFVEYKLNELNTTNSIVNSNFKLFFDRIPLIHKFTASKDHRNTLKWFETYYSIILDISYLTDDFCYEKLFEKYNLELKDPYFKPSVIKGAGIHSTKYSTFKKYLQFDLIPFVEKTLNALKFNVLIIEAKLKCPDKFKDDNDKFPVFDFHYESIQRYCEKVFLEIEDKIEYFLHILRHYNQLVDFKDVVPDNAHDCIPHIEKELKHYEALYKLKKGKGKDTVNITEKLDNINQSIEGLKKYNEKKIRANSIKDSALVKHYFTIAIRFDNIPSLPQLSIDIMNKSFWSKKLHDSTFLYPLSVKIKSKTRSKRLNNKTLNLFDRLKDDCDLKLKKALKKESSKTGQTNRKNKGFNENQINDEENDYSDFTA